MGLAGRSNRSVATDEKSVEVARSHRERKAMWPASAHSRQPSRIVGRLPLDGLEVRRTPDTRRTGSPSYVMYAERNLKNLWRVFGFLYGLVVLTLTNPHHSA